MLVVYQSWTGMVGGKSYYANRIWGKLGSFPGVEETMNDERVTMNSLPTIVRGVLFLPSASGTGRDASNVLLDVAGRKVMELHPGTNDVRTLVPGVYFVRSELLAVCRQRSAVTKVIVTE